MIRNPITANRSILIMKRIRGETKRITRLPAELRGRASGRIPHFLDVLLQAFGMCLLTPRKIKEDLLALRFGEFSCIRCKKFRYVAIQVQRRFQGRVRIHADFS